MYWPDNKLWYEITVVSVDLEAKTAKCVVLGTRSCALAYAHNRQHRVDYVVGETEELDLMEIIKDQHFNLLPA